MIVLAAALMGVGVGVVFLGIYWVAYRLTRRCASDDVMAVAEAAGVKHEPICFCDDCLDEHNERQRWERQEADR